MTCLAHHEESIDHMHTSALSIRDIVGVLIG